MLRRTPSFATRHRIFILALGTLSVRAHSEPPNIVFIFADDLGINGIGAFVRHFTGTKDADATGPPSSLKKSFVCSDP